MICPECLGCGWMPTSWRRSRAKRSGPGSCAQSAGVETPSPRGREGRLQRRAARGLRRQSRLRSLRLATPTRMGEKGRRSKDEALKGMRVTRPYYTCRGIRGSYRGDSLGDTRNSPEWCNKEHERIRPRRRLLDCESDELLVPSIRGRGAVRPLYGLDAPVRTVPLSPNLVSETGFDDFDRRLQE